MPPDPQPVSNETEALRAALDAANRTNAANAVRLQAVEGQLRRDGSVSQLDQNVAQANNVIATINAELGDLKRQLAEQQAEGNFTAAADLQERIGDATAKRNQAEQARTYYTQQREHAAQAPADPLANFNAAERAWIDQHPEYLTDPAFQRKVNAAALNAQENLGLPKDSKEYFAQIERTVYPERFRQQQAPADGGGAPAGDTGDGGDGPQYVAPHVEPFRIEPIDDGTMQQHTRSSPIAPPTPDSTPMRVDLDQTPQEPQQRAIGRDGGASMRSVAAPPSRRIADAAQRLGRSSRIEPTMEELLAARALAESIEPEVAQRGDAEIVKWYYALAHHPSHMKTRRRSWARDAVVA